MMTNKTNDINWEDVKNEAADILARYVRIKTVNPPGDEEEAAQFLASILKKDGIDSRIFLSAPKRASILARLSGGDRAGLILLSHIDTVGAEPSTWDFDPFSGQRKDGYVLGRGTLDDKGMGVMGLVALLLAKRTGLPLKRDVVFLATADEETGGEFGAGYMAREHHDKLTASFLINEGGALMKGILPDDRTACMIAVGEKGPLWLELSRPGTSGHGSVPVDDNAILKLAQAADRLCATGGRRLRFIDETVEFCAGLGGGIGGLKGALLKGVRVPFLRPLIGRLLAKTPSIGAMLTDTISLTTMHAGIKENVIPDGARMTVDVRLLPKTDKDEFIGWARKRMGDDRIEIREIFYAPASLSESTGEFFAAVSETARETVPDSTTIPMIATGFTDSRFFRKLGIVSYDLLPAPLTTQDVQAIHGKNERISEQGLLVGTKYMYHLIKRLCA
jgi:acetylornithine deacetylase/succinyl-diaminopimelate desuccinylase-like protein